MRIIDMNKLMPKAHIRAKDIDMDRDFLCAYVSKENCGCVKSIIEYQKDCGDFEDKKTCTVFDKCEEHNK